MKIVVPDYYDKFICVADECNHNCCIGWEIDIDNDTYYLYENTIGNIGDKLRKHIAEEDELTREHRVELVNLLNYQCIIDGQNHSILPVL